MRVLKAVAVALVMAWGVRVLHAADFYVAQKDPAANDANVGTQAMPFKTIGAAIPHLKGGDTLFIRSGAYRECVYLGATPSTVGGKTYPALQSRTPGLPIRITAMAGDEVAVKGSDLITGWKKYKDAIYVKDGWTDNTHQLFCDGKPLQQIAGDSGKEEVKEAWNGRKGNSLADIEKGSFFVDLKAGKLYLWTPQGDEPASHEIEYSVRPYTLTISDVQQVQVSGLKLLNAPVGLHGAFNMLQDCDIMYAEFCGLGVSGKCNTVLRCRIDYNGNTGVSTWGYGHRIIDCEISFNNRRLWSRHWHAGGMKNFSNDTLISGCVAEGNIDCPGIWFDGNNINNTIQNCRVFHNTNGIMYEIGERVVVKNNVCYENRSRGIDISNSSYSLIAFNLCYRNGKAGIGIYGGTRKEGELPYMDEETGVDPVRNNVVWGNILMDNWYEPLLPADEIKDGPELIMPDPSYKSNGGNISDYNLYYRSDGRPIRFWYNYVEKSFPDLKTWQEKTGQDRHSIVAQPLFKDLAKYDFHPADKSPAIDLVRPRLGNRLDMEDRDRRYKQMQTAGPYAGGKLQPPTARPERQAEIAMIQLSGQPLPKALALVEKSLAEIPIEKLPDGKTAVKLQGIPFDWSSPPKAIVLDKAHPSAKILIGRSAKALCLAHAMLNPSKKGLQAHCRIVREDGMTLELKWQDLDGLEQPVIDGKISKTEVGWKSQDGKARVFLTAWNNDNEWYPLREIEWVLDDDTATVLILGVTTK